MEVFICRIDRNVADLLYSDVILMDGINRIVQIVRMEKIFVLYVKYLLEVRAKMLLGQLSKIHTKSTECKMALKHSYCGTCFPVSSDTSV